MAPKVTIVANCQGGPLSDILKLFFGMEIVQVVAAHRAGAFNAAAFDKAVGASDFVVTQDIHATVPIPAIRTARLKETWPDKVVVWQNLYFKGYNPEVAYLRRHNGGHRRGPLGDYHITDVIEGHQAGASVAETIASVRDPDRNRARYAADIAATFAELRKREGATVTPVSDFVAEQYKVRRLFYTFNHPTNALLFRVAAQIAKAIGVKPLQRFRADLINEKLNVVLVPLNAAVAPTVADSMANWSHFTGFRAVPSETAGIVVTPGERTFYSLEDVVGLFYRLYDAMARDDAAPDAKRRTA